MKDRISRFSFINSWGHFNQFLIVFFVMLFLTGQARAQTSVAGSRSISQDEHNLRKTNKATVLNEALVSRVNEFVEPDERKIIRLPQLKQLGKAESEIGKPLQIGIVRPLESKLGKVSQGDVFSVSGGKVWIAEIISESAVQMRLQFSRMNLPDGAKVFVYSAANPNQIYGVYENRGALENGEFWTSPVEGDSLRIEYFTPDANQLTAEKLPFQISAISHIYRDPLKGCANGSFSPPELTCHNDVPLGSDEIARSVGLLQFTLPNGEYLCSGTLLNSVAQDFNPVLLTANHCFNTQAAAQSLKVYWFYEEGDTPSTSLPRSDGATLLSTGAANDYTLVRLLGSVPNVLGIFYSGWDAAATPVGTPVFGLHHPQGSHKRYSSGTTISGYCPTLPSACPNFTGVAWSSGAIESGSNGSGLWKGTDFETSRLIGTFSTGATGCANGRGSYSSFSLIYPNIFQYLQGGVDDIYDSGNGNDTRSAARIISSGNYSNLTIKWLDNDWYAVTVPAGYKITATTNFINNNGDIDLDLYRGNELEPVSFSYSTTDSEMVSHTANAATTYYLAVSLFDGARNDYNLNITVQQISTANRTPFDFDGDGKADVSVFRPSNGAWFVSRSSNNSFFSAGFGQQGDRITPADFDGDGKADIAVFRPSNGFWYRLNSQNGQFIAVQFGTNGDIPVAGDFDGDGKADIAVFRPSNGAWYRINSSNGQFVTVQFGTNGDKPQIADFDGDGKTDLAVWRPANGTWYILKSSDNAFYDVGFGQQGDIPTAADYDGDGKADFSVFRPSNGYWYRFKSAGGQFVPQQFGANEDVPAAADFDGDGKADIAVFRPATGTWYLLRSTAGFTGQQFGTNADIPTPAALLL